MKRVSLLLALVAPFVLAAGQDREREFDRFTKEYPALAQQFRAQQQIIAGYIGNIEAVGGQYQLKPEIADLLRAKTCELIRSGVVLVRSLPSYCLRACPFIEQHCMRQDAECGNQALLGVLDASAACRCHERVRTQCWEANATACNWPAPERFECP